MATAEGKAAKRAAAAATVVRVREATAKLILTEEPKGSPSHHGGRPFKCDKCNRSFSTGGQLTSHSCTKDRPYACTLCEKSASRSFTTMHNLKRHQTIHAKEQRYRCQTCGVLFCHMHKGARQGGASPESPRSSPRPGLESSAMSLSKSTLLLDHSTVKKKKKKAKQRSPLEVQMVQNLSENTRPPEAPSAVCAKGSQLITTVVRVREATTELILTEEPKGSPKRTGGRPFKCDKCNRSFSTGGQLTSHSCTKDRPYACTLCEKRFLTRSHFREHQRVHTGERPYTCHQCVRSFTTMHNLKRHQTIHAKEQRYRCQTCGVLFCHMHKGARQGGASPESPRSSPRPGLESSAMSLSKSTLLLDHSTVKKKKKKAKQRSPLEVQVPCGGDGGGVVTLRRNAGGMQNKIAYDIEVVL
ncbi:hypothetical protein MATL_G00070320 [Megalops atlanticus]|uniref:C2H2-type domain-containing protein n=1 Tax=Megalops atlanticus TaxID=7932 RepID=A0A9D3T8V1_MEGAT|nr:hypothetical protein MATL_G00070320 [Megalops atlanticus]